MTTARSMRAIIFIFIYNSIVWIILGTTVVVRTHEQDSALKRAVGQLWVMQLTGRVDWSEKLGSGRGKE